MLIPMTLKAMKNNKIQEVRIKKNNVNDDFVCLFVLFLLCSYSYFFLLFV